MPNIRVDLPTSPVHGQSLLFKAPANSSDISGLILYFPGGNTVFDFADAHGNNIGTLNMFANSAFVQVILDTELLRAYVQNADTNGYLESELGKRLLALESPDYPGCYYRTLPNTEEVEWINPPLVSGKEYRTLDRIEGKPVYIRRFVHVFTPSGSTNTLRVSLPSGATNVVLEPIQQVSGVHLIDVADPIVSMVSLFTVTRASSLITVAYGVDAQASKSMTACVTVKYTKPVSTGDAQ